MPKNTCGSTTRSVGEAWVLRQNARDAPIGHSDSASPGGRSGRGETDFGSSGIAPKRAPGATSELMLPRLRLQRSAPALGFEPDLTALDDFANAGELKVLRRAGEQQL